MIAVIRKPCFMEDEGRYQLLGVFDTNEEADKFINAFTKNDKAYFKKSDLVKMENHNA